MEWRDLIIRMMKYLSEIAMIVLVIAWIRGYGANDPKE